MQSDLCLDNGMNRPNDARQPRNADFRAAPLIFLPEQGLKTLLQQVEDLLFVLDANGRILNCKARIGTSLKTFSQYNQLQIEDLMSDGVKRKYRFAIEQFRRLGCFTVFENMLALPPSAVNWYEFRLIPAFENQIVLFIWNVNNYRELAWTLPNIPISIEKMIEGWSRSLYLRDFETEDHTRRVTEITVQLAHRLGLPDEEMNDIRRGARVHDIGKIAIPDRILLKTGKLTEGEWNVMRQHTLIAVDLLKPIPEFEKALLIPRSHHEKWDGSGYPDGLSGLDIPLPARIFAFADVYDALTTDRPYRRAWSRADALQYIQAETGKYFDPAITPEFIRLMLE